MTDTKTDRQTEKQTDAEKYRQEEAGCQVILHVVVLCFLSKNLTGRFGSVRFFKPRFGSEPNLLVV